MASDNERGKNTEVTAGASERWATESEKRADEEARKEKALRRELTKKAEPCCSSRNNSEDKTSHQVPKQECRRASYLVGTLGAMVKYEEN